MNPNDFASGIYPNVPELDYHARRFGPADSLSSTEAKRILTAPALFRYHRDNGQEHNPAFDLGHVVHALVLGEGLSIYVHDHESLRSKVAREDVEAHRDAGEVVIARADYQQATAMADAVLAHPVAGHLFTDGIPEQSIFAHREGVWMRGRIDWTCGQPSSMGDDVLVDLKTTKSADPSGFTRTVTAFGYDVQREWYRDIWHMLTGARPDFLHVLVEKSAPYLVSVVNLGYDFEEIGRNKVAQAIDTYARCMESGEWPGYEPVIHEVDAPSWYVTANGLDEIEVA